MNKISIADLDILMQAFSKKNAVLYIEDKKELILSPYSMTVPAILEQSTLRGIAITAPGTNVENFDLIIDYSNELVSNLPYQQGFDYLCNTDGSLRWIWPQSNTKPLFLSLYNSQNWKASVMKLILKAGWKTGIGGKLKHGSFRLHMKEKPFINELVSDQPYAMFTGTVGPNRKIVAYAETPDPVFVKISISNRSAEKIKDEKTALQYLPTIHPHHFTIPVIEESDERVLVQRIPHLNSVKSSSHLTDKHFLFADEISRKTLIKDYAEKYSWMTEINERIAQLRQEEEQTVNATLTRLILQLHKRLTDKGMPALSFAHGDFTPWNMYSANGRLYLYDWELSGVKPALSDLFHYVFQSSVMIAHHEYGDFKKALHMIQENHIVQKLGHDLHLDIATQYDWYLLDTASQYLQIYNEQKTIHPQASWIMQAWTEAIQERVLEEPACNMREMFISMLFTLLQKSDYLSLKFTEERVDMIPTSSDLDLLVTKETEKKILAFVKRLPFVQHKEAMHKSYMKTLRLYFTDGSFISIDLIQSFRLKWLQYLNAKSMLNLYRLTGENIRVPHKRYDFEYIMVFYIGNKSSVPERYRKYYSNLFEPEKEGIRLYLNAKYDLEAKSLEELYEYSEEHRKSIIKAVKKEKANKGFSAIKHIAHYFIDTIKTKLLMRGRVITLSGVDGAGKSTVLEDLKKHLQTEYREKIVVKRHRPSLLPILSSIKYGKAGAEKKAATSLPRQGNNNSTFSSLLRFIYYYTDYVVGQLYIYLRYTSRGITVLYDRYYFDIVVDGERSNIKLPKWFPELAAKLIIKPDLNILLYAPASTILKRKQELSAADIHYLTGRYLSYFEKRKNNDSEHRYVAVLNTDRNKTLKQIMYHYCKI